MRTFLFNALAVVAGYVAIAVGIILLFSLAYLILGAEGSFQPQSWDVTMAWNVVSIVVGFGVAWIGGKVCYMIARNLTAPKYLVALIVVLGVVSGLMSTMMGDGGEVIRDTVPSVFEAAQGANEPLWITWLNPLLGAVGAALGSGLLKFGSRT